HSKCGRIIDDHGAGGGCCRNEFARNFTACAKKSGVDPGERLISQLLHWKRFIAKRDVLAGCARRPNRLETRYRETAALQNAKKFGPNCAGRADNCDMIVFQKR